MRREVRVRIGFVVEVEDGVGLPDVRDVGAAIADVARILVPGATSVRPGGRLSVGLTRASIDAARRAARAARTPPTGSTRDAQLIPISTDDAHVTRVDDRPPASPIDPGASVTLSHEVQGQAVIFGRLRVSRQMGSDASGAMIVSPVDVWRVDEVTLDDAPATLVDGIVDPPRAARRVSMRVTNVAGDPAHLYCAWEVRAVPIPDSLP